jgi:ABC-type cobalamin/Fe3+-siderophores transport system ATPase subunit
VRSLCQPFDFIILDEPVSHLDARNNAIVAGMVRRVADQNGAGIITTSVGNPLLLNGAEHVKL